MRNRKLLRLIILLAVASAIPAQAIAQELTEPAPEPAPALKKVPKADEPAPPSPQVQADDQPAGTEGQTRTLQRRPPGGILDMLRDNPFIIILFGGMIFLFYWSSRSRRKQEAKRREMLAALKKGDKVTSIGGIVGTIMEIREDEVTVKVDENNNIRMKFARWAIRGIGDEAKTEAPDQRK